MAQLGMDVSSVEPASDMSALPDGEYLAMIADSTVKQTKNGQGQYLALTFQIIDGPFANRYVWHNLNLWNQNETAQRISQQQLSAICAAIDHTGVVQDSTELHNQAMAIKLNYIPANVEKGYKEKNEIKAFKKAEGAGAPTPQPVAQAQPQAVNPQAHTPPAANVAQAPGSAPVWAGR